MQKDMFGDRWSTANKPVCAAMPKKAKNNKLLLEESYWKKMKLKTQWPSGREILEVHNAERPA